MSLASRRAAAAATSVAALALFLSVAPTAGPDAQPDVVAAAAQGAAAKVRLTAVVNAEVALPGSSGTTVPEGSRVTIDVRAARAVKGQRLLLQLTSGTGRWSTIATARTDRRGVAVLRVPTSTPGQGTYRVVAPASRGQRAVVSRPVVVVVSPADSTAEPAPAPVPVEVPVATPLQGTADAYTLFDTGRAGSVFRWNPCAPVRYRVLLEGSPPDLDGQVRRAVAEVSAASGLSFEYLGTTSYAGTATDPAHAAWPADTDLVITVASELDSTVLAGSTVGYASLLRSSWSGADARIGRAEVVLEREFLTSTSGTGARVRELVMHELGHAVGLAHSADPTQVMYPSLGGQPEPTFQTGDRAGLARVGASQGCLA